MRRFCAIFRSHLLVLPLSYSTNFLLDDFFTDTSYVFNCFSQREKINKFNEIDSVLLSNNGTHLSKPQSKVSM